MPLDPADEPPIDLSLSHYMEEQALAVAMDKADTPDLRAKLEHLLSLQAALMVQRDAFMQFAIARRHARGEVYSKARVAALNAMARSRKDMDASVKTLYLCQPDALGVLKVHARTNFTNVMVSQYLGLALAPPDIAQEARAMHAQEEAFASAWIAAIADADFLRDIQTLRREAVSLFRTASRPMYLVTQPELAADQDDEAAAALGKIWSKLDTLAQSRGVRPLSDFIALGDEGDDAGRAAADILPTVEALLGAVGDPAEKFPSRKKALTLLGQLKDQLQQLHSLGGRAYFEVDI